MTLQTSIFFAIIALPWLTPASHAQSLDDARTDLLSQQGKTEVGVRVEDGRRRLVSDGKSSHLDLRRVVVKGESAVGNGASVWAEAGWQDAGFAGADGGAGLTWGVGGAWRLYRIPFRIDPEFGPKEWVALRLSGGYLGGTSDGLGGGVDWSQWLGRLGVEWKHARFYPDHGDPGILGWTLETGLVWNALDADHGRVDGSEVEDVGLYGHIKYQVAPSLHAGLGLDWFATSDRLMSLHLTWAY